MWIYGFYIFLESLFFLTFPFDVKLIFVPTKILFNNNEVLQNIFLKFQLKRKT